MSGSKTSEEVNELLAWLGLPPMAVESSLALPKPPVASSLALPRPTVATGISLLHPHISQPRAAQPVPTEATAQKASLSRVAPPSSSSLSSDLEEQIVALTQEKIEAVEVEDYERAESIKCQINEVKKKLATPPDYDTLKADIEAVQALKRAAVEKEDYEEAARLKARIDELAASSLATGTNPKPSFAKIAAKAPTSPPPHAAPAMFARSREQEHESDNGYCGYLFMCNNATEAECLSRMLLGDKESHLKKMCRVISPYTRIFLFNFDSRELHGAFRAKGPPALNLEKEAWNGKFCAQVRLSPQRSEHRSIRLSPEIKMSSGPKTTEEMAYLMEKLNLRD